jgi:hypothetical protein
MSINHNGEHPFEKKTHQNDIQVHNMTKNITVTIPIKQKHQSLIAAAIGANGNNIKSVKSRIISGLSPKFLYIYIKGDDGHKYWHITVSVTDPQKWKLLEKAQNFLDRHLDFFYRKKNTFEAARVIQLWYRAIYSQRKSIKSSNYDANK